MHEFELVQPTSLVDALETLAQNDATIRPLAGGTDMIVDIRSGRAAPRVLVSLQNISELRGINRDNRILRIGAATTISEFLTHPALVPYQALNQAASLFANPMIRNSATIAGNINSASPAGDMLPPLLALGAQVELVSANSSRIVPLDQFFLGPRKTVKHSDELISNLQLPAFDNGTRFTTAFYKLGLRQADAISIVSVAIALDRAEAVIRDVRIALGAVAPRPIRALGAETLLRGEKFTASSVAEAARIAAQECSPINDLRASAKYRRRMIAVYVRRLLEQTWDQIA